MSIKLVETFQIGFLFITITTTPEEMIPIRHTKEIVCFFVIMLILRCVLDQKLASHYTFPITLSINIVIISRFY